MKTAKGNGGVPRFEGKPDPEPPMRKSPKEKVQVAWNDFLDFIIPFFFDAAKGASILLVLFLFAWLFNLGKAIGVKQEYLDAFETIHFWANVSTYAMISFAFVLRLYRSLRSENHR